MRTLTTSELRAARPKRDEFDQLPKTPAVIVVDNLTSGFNVGSLFRIADAFRLERLYLCGSTPLPPRARITKTSMGSERWVEWSTCPSAEEALAELEKLGYHRVAIELTEEAVPLAKFDFQFPLALVIGDEMMGISPDALAACEASVAIPMLGMGNSLNVVMAAAIVVYQMSSKSEVKVS